MACALAFGLGCGSKGGMAHSDGGDAPVDHPGTHPDGSQTDAPTDAGMEACPITTVGKLAGQACSCTSECAGGLFCADGVCCTTACTESCKTCAGTGSEGTCTNLPTGAKPGAGKSAACTASDPSTCGLDGKCDGLGACRSWPQGTTCKAGSCDGDAVVNAGQCDGMGQCKAGATKICVPFTCGPSPSDPKQGDCYNACTDGTQCSAGHVCSGGSCGARMRGMSCVKNSDCQSGFCADGVCCNVACQGPCVSCSLPLKLGTCWPTDEGLSDPRGICVDQGKPSCGQTGTCDGVGGCSKYPRDTMCEAPSCSGNKLNTAGTCDGRGTCQPPGLTDCHPFRCVNGACTSSCQTNADCDAGIACVNGTCGPKLNGQACAASGECVSNYCVDGVCCESACTGACRSCALPGSPGRCVAVAAGNTDPRGVCLDEKPTSCGRNGKCDGSGSCQTYPVNTQCGPESCSGNVYTPPSTCNSSGQCVAPDSLPCKPYVCNGTKCFTACTTNSQCLSPNQCTSNICGLVDDGAACDTAAQCKSGFCEQGTCCHTACSGPCVSCALTGSLGVCSNVATNAVDPAGMCTDQGQMSCGTNGKCQAGACQKYLPGTSCKDPSCPTGTTSSTAGSACDGAGVCVVPSATSCFPFLCGANACKNACTTDADCSSPAVCINGSCGLKPIGLACTSAAECQSNFCAQGYCCQTACTGTCKSCGLAPSLGTCSNVPAGSPDVQSRCSDMGAASCSTDGFCDGNGSCRLYNAGTSCAAPTCPAGATTQTSGRTCDGHGVCQPATTLACAPYYCNGSTACKAACTADADCSQGICDPATNKCGNKQRLGQPCSSTNDCLTGATCVDGVCCSATACGTCQACNVTGNAGNCANVPLGTAEPHGLCSANPPCGNTGSCNGAGACQQAATTVSCGTASCSGSTYTPISHCNGNGGCAAPTATSCGSYLCGNGVCKTTCTSDADCVSPTTCQAGNCALKPNGQVCAANNQCISGFCTNGVCCGSASCPTCQACNVNGQGSCAPLVAGTAAPSGQCPAGPPCGNTGACDGSGGCQQAAASVSCGSPSCSGSTFTPVSHCDGVGGCATPVSSSCVPYVCGTNACRTDCSSDADCLSGYYCTGAGGACMPKKSSGATCSLAHECGTGLCTDGHCCGVASCPLCQACGSAGMCANVGAGTTDSRCVASPPCGNTGACDGAGACALAATTVSCGSPSCTGSTYTPISHCDGAGTCAPASPSTCVPYVCSGNTCRSNCTTSAHCVSGYYCSGPGGSCLPKKQSGATCSSADECGTGFCTNGVCCGVAACPTCQVCGGGGQCVNLPAGTSAAACTPSPPCGNTGFCDGAGSCAQSATTVQCGNASCSGTTYTPPAFCSGGGSCLNPGTVSCGAYVCGTGACKTSCGSDTDCTSGNYCTGSGGSCLAKKSPGDNCSADHECGTSHCVDGVCCMTASCSTCQSCSLSGNGTCQAVGNNSPEPHGLCPVTTTCGNTGLCSGGTCQKAATSVQCGSPSCSSTTFTPAAFCNGSGSCGTPTTQSCAPYVCGTGACKFTCASDNDCTAGNYCTGPNGSCASLKSPGASCTADHECGTGHCTDGVCCTSAACGTCQSCAASANGTCAAVPNLTAEPHGLCGVTTTCGNTGLCVGGACQQAASSVQCGNASCSGSTFTPAAFCTGGGTCGTPTTQSCGVYVCGTGACKTSCSYDTDCTTGNFCNSGACVALRAAGAACTADNQCGTGHCTDGVCCTSGACGTCQSCAASGNGTCAAVANLSPEPHGLCPVTTTCGNTGVCFAGACQQAATTVMCQTSFCVSSSFQPAGYCSGTGTCSVPSPVNCSPFACNTSGCLGSCSADTDCISGDYCASNGTCQPKQLNGLTCARDSQCSSGHCTDGFCCLTGPCTTSCQSCNVPGSEGMCSNVLAGTKDPTGTCTDQGSASCGQNGKCTSTGACQLYDSSTVCAESCASDGSSLTGTLCDGFGTCGPATNLPTTCPTNVCSVGPPLVCQ